MKRLFLASLAVLVVVSTAGAGDFRCGTRLVSEGDTKFEVLEKCGQPDFVDVRHESRIKRDFFERSFERRDLDDPERYRFPLFVVEDVEIEEWTYNLGSQRFIRYLTFENGRLVDIKVGDYGY